MIKRLFIIAIELVAGLFGVAVLAFALLFWRLSTGPIHLDFATPFIEETASSREAGIEVKIQETMLVWAGLDRAFDIRVNNTTILGSGGKILASLPEVTVGFSIAALFDGVIAPKRLEVKGVDATVERGDDGRLVLGFFSQAKSVADAEFAQRIPNYIGLLSKPHNKTSVFGYLDVVRITDVDLRYLDRVNGAVWHSPDSDIELLRGSDGLEAVFSMELDFGERSTKLTAHAVFLPERPVVDIGIAFDKLVPSDVTGRFAALQDFPKVNEPYSGQLRILAQQSGVVNSVAFDLKGGGGTIAGNVIVDPAGDYDMTVNLSGVNSSALVEFVPQITDAVLIDTLLDIRASGRIGPAGQIRRLKFDVNAEEGSITIYQRFIKALEFESIEIAGEVRNDFDAVSISVAKLYLGETELEARIEASRIGENLRTRLEAGLRKFKMSELSRYWPNDFGAPARSWATTNLHSGYVERGDIALVIDLPLYALNEPKVRSISGSIEYKDLVVDYFKPFPKITNVDGTATFTHDRFDLIVTNGTLLDLDLDHGVINMTRLDTDNESVAIDLVLRGPLATALVLADRKPLLLLDGLGLDPATVKGEMAARLALDFPLRQDLHYSQVKVSSAANLRGVGMNPGPFDFVLTDSNLELKISDDIMKVTGEILLNDVPLSLDWHEVLGISGGVRSRYILSGKVDANSLSRFGLPDISVLGGSIEANLIFTKFDDGRSEVLASGDLDRTMISVPRFGWLKSAGEPGSFRLGATISNDGIFEIDNFSTSAANMEAVGKVGFENGSWTAEFENLRIGNTRVRGSLSRRDDGVYLAKIDGGNLDLEPVLYGDGIESREVQATSGIEALTIILNADLNSVRMGRESWLGTTKAQARFLGSDLDLLEFEAGLPNQKWLHASYNPDGGGHLLQVRSDDAGQALVALGWTEKLEGGVLKIDGRREMASAPLRGRFKLADYKLSSAPALAKLLQIASLTGIFDALQRGLDFTSFDGKFSYRDGILQIDKSRTYGSSIGITVEGMLDLDEDEVDLKGTVVPAYTVNRVLGQIPILGPILTGGEDEGVFAATYDVTGRLDDPIIVVNPLSALAPGFLRKLFDLIGSGEPPNEVHAQ